jgi:hypothetical protein
MSMSQLVAKPCPFCGCDRVIFVTPPNGCQAECTQCRACGPLTDGFVYNKDTWIALRNKAIQLWNKGTL